jgi:hypothetical protein
MRVLKLTGDRLINVVLRDYAKETVRYDVKFYNENTKAISTLEVTKTVAEIQANSNMLQFVYTEDRVEGDEFSFYIYGKGEAPILHRNKIFFTDKVPQNYSINE